MKIIKENYRLLNNIHELIALEKDQGSEYPKSEIYLKFYTKLRDKISKNELAEIFNYLAYGDSYLLKNNKLADNIREIIYNIAIATAKKLFPPYDIRNLEIFIRKYKNKIEKSYNKKIQNIPDYFKIFNYLDDIVNLLLNPYKIIIPEETEFPSLKKEINSYINLIKKEAKKNFTIFNDTGILNTLIHAIPI